MPTVELRAAAMPVWVRAILTIQFVASRSTTLQVLLRSTSIQTPAPAATRCSLTIQLTTTVVRTSGRQIGFRWDSYIDGKTQSWMDSFCVDRFYRLHCQRNNCWRLEVSTCDLELNHFASRGISVSKFPMYFNLSWTDVVGLAKEPLWRNVNSGMG